MNMHFLGGQLEGTGITQGLAIAPWTLGFWENHLQPTKLWKDSKHRFDCVPIQRA